MASDEPADPRDFTAAEWNVIAAALRERANVLEWKAGRPGLSPVVAERMLAAARRRRELASRVVGAKIFCLGPAG